MVHYIVGVRVPGDEDV